MSAQSNPPSEAPKDCCKIADPPCSHNVELRRSLTALPLSLPPPPYSAALPLSDYAPLTPSSSATYHNMQYPAYGSTERSYRPTTVLHMDPSPCPRHYTNVPSHPQSYHARASAPISWTALSHHPSWSGHHHWLPISTNDEQEDQRSLNQYIKIVLAFMLWYTVSWYIFSFNDNGSIRSCTEDLTM
ncbi:uncharacterized protein BYT42DRAFT_570288 [Radiomyces spectabilis]|uniref:uncharacterized protein n=1 Tax=Radiomyces spectabilis TaxID=64574 RepID=UPI00221EB96F|nr:uncharacterized protein BYT42DRAFT_570288 [Radiomyces spectabilis]KAI8377419.1 hypothetical protein BYT42DRAFT_570288 [Radiomyces spectabilis]